MINLLRKIKMDEEKLNLYSDMMKVINSNESLAFKYLSSPDNKYRIPPIELLETKEGKIKFVMLINSKLK